MSKEEKPQQYKTENQPFSVSDAYELLLQYLEKNRETKPGWPSTLLRAGEGENESYRFRFDSNDGKISVAYEVARNGRVKNCRVDKELSIPICLHLSAL